MILSSFLGGLTAIIKFSDKYLVKLAEYMNPFKYFKNYFYYLKSKHDPRSRICQICLSVTDQCNSRCTQCSAWKSYLLDPSKKEKEFKLYEIEKMLKSSKSLTYLNTVSLTGGEPILREDLIEVVKTIDKEHKGIRFFLQSNGLNFEKLIEKAKEMISFSDTTLCISVDGINSTHDKVRGIKGGFKITKQTIKKLHDNGIEISLSCNITPANYLEIEKVWTEFKDTINYFSCRPIAVGAFFKTSEKNEFVLNKKQRNFVIKQLERINYAKNLFVYQVSRILFNQKRFFPCRAGYFSVIITPTLDVYPCSACPEDWCFGNLRDVDYNLDALLESEKGRKIKTMVNACRKYETEFCINEPEFFSTAHFQIFRLFFWLLVHDLPTLWKNIFHKKPK